MVVTNTTKNIAKGVSILGITGLICKVVGLLFSIPLNMIHSDAVAANEIATLFYKVYPTYTLLLTVSSAGLPVAVSRLVAGFMARGDSVSAKKTFKVALMMLVCLGAFCSLLMLILNGFLSAVYVNDADASLGFYMIAPCVLFVCVLSAFRGFIQGQQNMLPTAVSQLIEQVGKVFVSLPLAYFGVHVYNSRAMGAAGALLGLTISEAAAMLYMIIRFYFRKKEYNALPQTSSDPSMDSRELLRRLILISIPITINACIIPLSNFIDSHMMTRRMMDAGLTWEAADHAYGAYQSVVIRFINIPTALALAIAMNLVPAVSARRALNDDEGVRAESNTGLRYAFLIGFPCTVGMSLLSHQAVAFFYEGTFPAEKLLLSADLLTWQSLTIVLFTVVQAASGILQGIRRQKIPMYAMLVGVGLKILLNYILIGTPGINIFGGPIASIVCYSAAMVITLYYSCRYTKMKFNWMDWILRPGLASSVMGIAVYTLSRILPGGRLSTVIEIFAGIVIFAAAAVMLKAVSLDELRKMLKRGRK